MQHPKSSPCQDDASEASSSVTQLKAKTSDLDLRVTVSSENEEMSGHQDSAQELADYFKWREQASDVSLLSNGSRGGDMVEATVDLTNVEESSVRG